MGRPKQADYHYFDDDTIALYTRPGSKAWQARIRLDTGKGIVKSTGKSDLKEALAVARKMQAQGQVKIEMGIDPTGKTFRFAAESFLKRKTLEVEKKVAKAYQLKEATSIINRYLIPYLGKFKLTTLNQRVFDEYAQWRADYWISGPGSKLTEQTYTRKDGVVITRKFTPKERVKMSGEDSTLRQVMQHALDQGWCDVGNLPTITRKRDVTQRRKNRRPAFSEAEAKRLIEYAAQRVDQTNDPRVRHDRLVFSVWLKLLYHSGLRPGSEYRQLRWADLQLQTQYNLPTLRVSHDTKTGSRVCVIGVEGMAALQMFQMVSPWRADKDYIFADHKTGLPVGSFYKQFNTVLSEIGLEHDVDGKKFTPYSLRHSYATERLEEEMDARLVAKNMGTSLQMIEEHYGHDTPVSRGREFIQARERKSRVPKA